MNEKVGAWDCANIAVLIDAENTDVYKMGDVLEKLCEEGRIAVKRAYGDFTNEALEPWFDKAKEFGIKLIFTPNYVPKKNSADITLIVEAMELLNAGLYDTFVIVSSDSDFTSIALHLREKCIKVIGIGKKKSPISLINACDSFLSLEDFLTDEERIEEEKRKKRRIRVPEELHECIKKAWRDNKDEKGFAWMGKAGIYIRQEDPEFKPQKYGYKKLMYLIRDFPELYEIQSKEDENSTQNDFYCCKEEE